MAGPSLDALRQTLGITGWSGALEQRCEGVGQGYRLEPEILQPGPGRPGKSNLGCAENEEHGHHGREQCQPARQTHGLPHPLGVRLGRPGRLVEYRKRRATRCSGIVA